MQIAVLSDFHLGTKNALDRFARHADTEAHFINLLGQLERQVDRIVLLGDIFETLRGRRPGSCERELRGALAAYPQIARRVLEDRRYQLVQGNHDAIVTRALGVPDVLRIRVPGTKLLFLHGHQFDFFARGEAPISRLFVCLGGWLERMGLRLTTWLDRLHLGRRDGVRYEAGAFERAAVALAESEHADVVVTGHTHRAARMEIGQTLYMNSGTCVAGRREFLLLDTESHRYEVVS